MSASNERTTRNSPFRIGSLFSGIGGIDLGLERAGVGRTMWQVESDPFCRRVLAKHWPLTAKFDDVRFINTRLADPVDVVCGGFPCQNISSAGKKEGIYGAQSFLWREFARVLKEFRPRFAVIENSAALRNRGLDLVLRDLALLGFDAEWSTLSACAVGAPHLRRRLFILAYANDDREPARALNGEVAGVPTDASEVRRGWDAEPSHVRVADGVPSGLDARRLAALGNACVPACAERVGRRLIEIAQSMGRAAA